MGLRFPWVKSMGKLVTRPIGGMPMGASGVTTTSRKDGIEVFTCQGNVYCLLYCNFLRVVS